MTTQTPIEREEMRAIRRDYINYCLQTNATGKRKYSYYQIINIRLFVRDQEERNFGYRLTAYKGFSHDDNRRT